MTAIKAMSLKELNEALAGKSKLIYDIQREAGPDLDFSKVTSLQGDTTAKVATLQTMNKELDEIGAARDPLIAAQAALKRGADYHEEFSKPVNRMVHPSAGEHKGEGTPEVKEFGKLFVESLAYKNFHGRQGPSITLDVDLKAVFRTGAGWAPPQIRLPGYVLSPQRPIAVVDSVPMLPTSSDTIRYMLESTFTSTAVVETAEQTATTAADAIGEAALALTETTMPIEWLPAFLPVTMQQMEDVEGIEAYVSSRLQYMLRARLDSQTLNGDGSTPNLRGTINVASINSQAKGSDPTPDAIYKAMTLIRSVGFAEPSVVFVHPNDWQDVRLLRTADGVYIWGSPSDAGPERIWGVPVVQTTAVVENGALLGDYANFAALYTKRGINIEVSDSHAFYFTRGLLAIRADMRVAMVHFRAKAFAKVTGI